MNLDKSTVILTKFINCEKTVMLDNIDESTKKDLQPKKKKKRGSRGRTRKKLAQSHAFQVD